MRGEEDRECRARGGEVKKQSKANVEREFRGAFPKNTPDASAKRGAGPLFRKRGGKIPEAFKKHEFNGVSPREEHAEGGEVPAARPAKKTGGAIAGAAAKPNLGRAGRARGGGVGSDLKPLTSSTKPRKPEGGVKFMAESERTP